MKTIQKSGSPLAYIILFSFCLLLAIQVVYATTFDENAFPDDFPDLADELGGFFDDTPKQYVVENALYLETEYLYNYLDKKFPADQYVIVTLGRSPTFLNAYHAAKYGLTANPENIFIFNKNSPWHSARYITLPLSGSSYVPRSAIQPPTYLGKLLEDETTKLYAYFRKFLPTPKQLGNKRLLLLDYSVTGSGLIGAKFSIIEYYKQSFHYTQKISSIALVSGVIEEIKKGKYIDHQINLRKLAAPKLMDALMASHHKEYALYGSYSLYDINEKKLPQPLFEKFALFSNQFREHIRKAEEKRRKLLRQNVRKKLTPKNVDTILSAMKYDSINRKISLFKRLTPTQKLAPLSPLDF